MTYKLGTQGIGTLNCRTKRPYFTDQKKALKGCKKEMDHQARMHVIKQQRLELETSNAHHYCLTNQIPVKGNSAYQISIQLYKMLVWIRIIRILFISGYPMKIIGCYCIRILMFSINYPDLSNG